MITEIIFWGFTFHQYMTDFTAKSFAKYPRVAKELQMIPKA